MIGMIQYIELMHKAKMEIAELEEALNKANGEWQAMQAALEAEKVKHAKTRAAHAALLLQTRTAHEALMLQRQEMRRKEIKRTDAAMDELFEKQLRQSRELKAIERERDFLQASVRTLEAEGLRLAIAGEE